METPIDEAQVWDDWNTEHCYGKLDEASERRMHEVLLSLADLKIQGAKILEVGCGAGRLSPSLCEFGRVTAVDLGKKIIEIAKARHPEVDFRSGDILTLDLPVNSFDVIVTLGTLAHIADQDAFMRRLAQLLKPGGFLLLNTQNKFVLDRREDIGPANGWIRKWTTVSTLKRLLRPEFSIQRLTTLEPGGHLGVLRIINSQRINHYLDAALGAARVKRLKESAGLGRNIYVVAVKR
jgi:2-polyprenyl-3-methyl-5-hydroxy-6-metoxy-1,4-benzoquinol methylase